MQGERKRPGLGGPITGLLITVAIVGMGVWAYTNERELWLFGVIPLNIVVFVILAIVMLAWSIWSLIGVLKARKR